MAQWVRGKVFGTSMCNKCGHEIPYMQYRQEGLPDPDTCPKCGEFMENGYGNVERALKSEVFSALSSVRYETIPKEFGIYNKDEIKMWENVFEAFLEELRSENGICRRV